MEYHTSQGPNYNFAAFSKGTPNLSDLRVYVYVWKQKSQPPGVGVCLYVSFRGCLGLTEPVADLTHRVPWGR